MLHTLLLQQRPSPSTYYDCLYSPVQTASPAGAISVKLERWLYDQSQLSWYKDDNFGQKDALLLDNGGTLGSPDQVFLPNYSAATVAGDADTKTRYYVYNANGVKIGSMRLDDTGYHGGCYTAQGASTYATDRAMLDPTPAD